MSLAAGFASRLLAWYDRSGRHDLPWQHPRTPYRIWVAEIMLQQTQVATVLPYYRRFLATFPDLPALAAADLDAVLALWSGLGYYSRARNLHATARRCVETHDGDLPTQAEVLTDLPGIGRSTAAAILAQAHGQRLPILDGNVRRVLCRLFAVDGWPGERHIERSLWQLAEALLPEARLPDYTQAIMDFGATLCRRGRPDCERCPFGDDCLARQRNRVAELPAPRPRRESPHRRCTMLVVEDEDGRLLLQRRPPVGIWGGLWSLPQFEDRKAAEHWAARLGPSLAAQELPAFEHVFTHFRLHIEPLHLRIAQRPAGVADDASLQWTDTTALGGIGLPAPVRRLLSNGS